MKTCYTFNNLIYESPDGGRTVYQRKQGETVRTLAAQNMSTRIDPMEQLRYNITFSDFIDICRLAETNLTLKEHLTQTIAIYNLVKDNE